MAKKILQGTVVSLKNTQTAAVDVEVVKVHPRYKKRFRVNKKYLCHVENIELKEGDKVVIIESRPLSKMKKWVVSEVVGGSK